PLHPSPPPFPTRRSSDLRQHANGIREGLCIASRQWPRGRYERSPAARDRNYRTDRLGTGTARPDKNAGAEEERVADHQGSPPARSEEHTSELQSRRDLVC